MNRIEEHEVFDMVKSILADKIIPTLRDQFAMAALTGLCGLNWRTTDTEMPTAKDHAKQSYKYADAMLAQRKV